jgi:nucleoside-triphosphatase
MMSTQSSVHESLGPFKNLLLTGSPGCAKTTVLERVAKHLGDYRLAGFLTLELREHGQRVGFEAIGLGGRRAILAHVRFRSLVSVGRYGVEPDRLVPLINQELVRPPGTVDAYLIDEIGRMECHCPQFIEAIRRILEEPVPVVATIALRGGGFIAERADLGGDHWQSAKSAGTDRCLGQATHGSGEYTLRQSDFRRQDDGLVRSQQRRGVAATQPGIGG